LVLPCFLFIHFPLLNLLDGVKASNFFKQDNISKTDIMLNLWPHPVDLQYMYNPYLRCLRDEISSKASAARRATHAASSLSNSNNRKPMGHRADILIRVKYEELAYMFSEAIILILSSSKCLYT
jgi:hypothetical protein